MNELTVRLPESVPAARKALAAMEKDIEAAKTYSAIRRLERQAEAIKILYREFREVGQDAERVMLAAKIRIGEELERAPVAKGLRGRFTGGPHSGPPVDDAPTLAEQVGSKQRGIRLKKLAEVGKTAVMAAAETLWAKGKEATQSAVLKLISGEAAKARREASRSAEPLPDGMDLRIGDCRKVLADVPDNSVPLILTDPPYPAEAEPLYEWLAEFAARVLIPGGSLICYTGHWSIPRDVRIFDKHLRYWWLLVMMHDQSRRLPGKFIIANFKPVLWYVKDHRRGRSLMPDVLKPPRREKDDHPWGQGSGGVEQIIEHLTEPGELVIDPFAGTATWGRVATSMGRRWIGSDIVEGGNAEIQAAAAE